MIQSVKRVSDILSLFSFEKHSRGITEISKIIGLPKSTVSSLVKTMSEVGFLEQDTETKRYRLGPKLFTLGILVSETLPINQKAGRIVQDLAEKTGLICRIAIWDYDAVLITLNAVPRDAEFLARRIGPRIVAYCTSLGRVLLAYKTKKEVDNYLVNTKLAPFTPHTINRKNELLHELKLIRQQGYSINNQELSIGRASVAVPVYIGMEALAAAISLAGDPEQIAGTELKSLVASLQDAAAEISREMGYTPGMMS